MAAHRYQKSLRPRSQPIDLEVGLLVPGPLGILAALVALLRKR
jgi:hypothetical protein